MFSWTNLVTQIVSGGFVGYITNTLAINMLFKEYTPLKLGGVIKKTKDEFIENISQLVENSIITYEKVHEEFSKDKFKDTIKDIFDDILDNSLHEKIGDLKLDEIASFDELIINLKDNIAGDLEQSVKDIVDLLLRQASINTMINENDIKEIIICFIDVFARSVENSVVFDNIIKEIIKSVENIPISKLIDMEMYNKIRININESITKLNIEYFDSNKPTIDSNLNSIFDEVDFEGHLLNIYEIILKQSFKSILSNPNNKDNLLEVNNRIAKIINSEGFKSIGFDLTKKFIDYLSTLDKTIFDFVTPKFEDKFEKFLRDVLPILLINVSLLIKKYSSELEEMIIISIDHTIDQGKGIRSSIVKLIKSKILDIIKNEHPPVKFIIEKLESQTESDIKQLCDKIIKVIKESKVNDIMKNANLNEDDKIQNIAEKAIIYLGHLFKAFPKTQIESLSSKQIRVIINEEQDKIIRTWIEKESRKFSINLIYKETSIRNMTDLYVDSFFNSAQKKSLGDFLFSNSENIIRMLKGALLEQLSTNNEIKTKWIIDNFIQPISSKSFDELFSSSNRAQIENSLIKLIKSKIDETYKNNKSRKLIDIKRIFDKVDNLSVKLSELFHSSISGNLKAIMDGNVKKIVKDNLNKFNEDEICDLVQAFMGKELKPITYLGALFGGIVGIVPGLYYSSGNFGLVTIIINMVIFAFVGWFTNVLAIEMLFKPYSKSKILSKIPYFKNFSTGYIIKNKDDFALKMAQFVQNDLLDVKGLEVKLNMFYSNNRELLINKFDDGKNKFALEWLENNKESNIKQLRDEFNNELVKRETELIDNIINFIDSYEIGDDLIDLLNVKLKNEVISHITEITERFNSTIYEMTTSNKFNDFLFNKVLEIDMSDYGDIGSRYLIDFLKRKNILEDSILGLFNQNTDKELGNLISFYNSDKYISRIIDKILSANNLDKVFSNISKSLETEFLLKRNLDSAWNGAIKKFSDKTIENFFEFHFDLIIKVAIKHKNDVKKSVNESIKSELSPLIKVGYDVLNMSKLVDSTIDNLFDEPIPSFLNIIKNDLKDISFDFVNKSIYTIKMDSIENLINKTGINNVISEVIASEDEQSTVRKKLSLLLTDLINEFKVVKVTSILKALDIDSETKLKKRFSNIFSTIQKNSFEIINENHEIILPYVKSIINDYIDYAKVNMLNTNAFVFERSDKHLSSIKHFLETLGFEKIVYKFSHKGLTSFLIDILQNKKITDFIGSDKLNKIFCFGFFNIIKDQSFITNIEKILYKYYDFFPEKLLNCLPKQFSKMITSVVVDASYEAIKPKMNRLLSDINFDVITETAIKNMNGEEIHRLFNSFAGKYFIKIKNYGIIGGFFGIHSIIGIILGPLFVGYEHISSKIAEKNINISETD